jgi:hypothetical protein
MITHDYPKKNILSRPQQQPAERIVNAPRKRGRPLKQIDERQVVELASIGCTYREMSAILDVNIEVLDRRFSKQITKARESMHMSLRRWQLKTARNGNVAMLIWLGKNMLGQTDKQEYTERTVDYSKLTDDELEALAAAESIY